MTTGIDIKKKLSNVKIEDDNTTDDHDSQTNSTKCIVTETLKIGCVKRLLTNDCCYPMCSWCAICCGDQMPMTFCGDYDMIYKHLKEKHNMKKVIGTPRYKQFKKYIKVKFEKEI